ncbi:hypothetical protein QBC35DRAFT_507393 [Podospora australis]|uniref:Uncharacterized protein n=1 Tax=Podospora australis TaxID=1536484 RepID=A0AAN6WP38_9PEZI|nr:hypothetical protein QBC35DRAFT_507393 [Podospora australis]
MPSTRRGRKSTRQGAAAALDPFDIIERQMTKPFDEIERQIARPFFKLSSTSVPGASSSNPDEKLYLSPAAMSANPLIPPQILGPVIAGSMSMATMPATAEQPRARRTTTGSAEAEVPTTASNRRRARRATTTAMSSATVEQNDPYAELRKAIAVAKVVDRSPLKAVEPTSTTSRDTEKPRSPGKPNDDHFYKPREYETQLVEEWDRIIMADHRAETMSKAQGNTNSPAKGDKSSPRRVDIHEEKNTQSTTSLEEIDPTNPWAEAINNLDTPEEAKETQASISRVVKLTATLEDHIEEIVSHANDLKILLGGLQMLNANLTLTMAALKAVNASMDLMWALGIEDEKKRADMYAKEASVRKVIREREKELQAKEERERFLKEREERKLKLEKGKREREEQGRKMKEKIARRKTKGRPGMRVGRAKAKLMGKGVVRDGVEGDGSVGSESICTCDTDALVEGLGGAVYVHRGLRRHADFKDLKGGVRFSTEGSSKQEGLFVS